MPDRNDVRRVELLVRLRSLATEACDQIEPPRDRKLEQQFEAAIDKVDDLLKELILGDDMEAPRVISLIRADLQEARQMRENVLGRAAKNGWAARERALVELLQQIPGTSEATALALAERRNDG